jgi:hypothetical protein
MTHEIKPIKEKMELWNIGGESEYLDYLMYYDEY